MLLGVRTEMSATPLSRAQMIDLETIAAVRRAKRELKHGVARLRQQLPEAIVEQIAEKTREYTATLLRRRTEPDFIETDTYYNLRLNNISAEVRRMTEDVLVPALAHASTIRALIAVDEPRLEVMRIHLRMLRDDFVGCMRDQGITEASAHGISVTRVGMDVIARLLVACAKRSQVAACDFARGELYLWTETPVAEAPVTQSIDD